MTLFIALLGLIFGSFITLASHRLPHGEDVVFKSSRCPKCGTNLGWRDLFPLFSWVSARGKCRHCGASVHWRYPAIELTTAGFFLLIYGEYGVTWQAAALMLMAVTLLIMVVADFEHYLIPDEVHYVLAPLAILYRHVFMHDGWAAIAAGGALGLSIGLLLRYGYWLVRRRHGLGLGDVKFLLVVGLWLDAQTLVPFFFFAGILGIITGLLWRAAGLGQRFPFGPALAATLFLCVAFPGAPAGFWHVQEAILGGPVR